MKDTGRLCFSLDGSERYVLPGQGFERLACVSGGVQGLNGHSHYILASNIRTVSQTTVLHVDDSSQTGTLGLRPQRGEPSFLVRDQIILLQEKQIGTSTQGRGIGLQGGCRRGIGGWGERGGYT